MNSVLIIDDDKELCTLMKKCVEQENLSAVVAHGGLEGLRLLEENKDTCSLIILDVMMPDMNGFQVLQEIRKKNNVPVLMLTAKDRETDIVMGLDNGADDYMTKPFGILELSARVRNLLKRSGTVREESTCLAAGDVKIDKETREVVSCGEKVELTLKEFELLSYLMEHMNRVVTRDELLDNIWGYDYDGETRTLDMHIKTLRQKLKDAGQQIKTVRGVGYRFLKEKER